MANSEKTRHLGITGGIGSGKSHVSKIFECFGIQVFNSDEVAKELIEKDITLKNGIIELLGKEAYAENGKYNRTYVAKTVFENKALLNSLNSLVHPAVAKNYLNWRAEQAVSFTLQEAALLVETGGYSRLDGLIVVVCPLSLRLKRLAKRDPFRSNEELQKIIANQLSDEQRIKVADFVIENNEEKSLISQVNNIIEILKEK